MHFAICKWFLNCLSMHIFNLLQVGRAVPVILPDDVKQGLRYLADSSVRASVGISSSNEYLFASEGK